MLHSLVVLFITLRHFVGGGGGGGSEKYVQPERA